MLQLIQQALDRLRVTRNHNVTLLPAHAQALHDAEWGVLNELARDVQELHAKLDALAVADRAPASSPAADGS